MARLIKVLCDRSWRMEEPFKGDITFTCQFSISDREAEILDRMPPNEIRGYVAKRLKEQQERANRFEERRMHRRGFIRRPITTIRR